MNRFISSKLKKSNRLLPFVMNVSFTIMAVSICLFTMFMIGLQDTANETLDGSDANTLKALMLSVGGISIACIVFFSWMLNTEIRVLFQTRKQFNVMVRLIGLNSKKLSKIYINEIVGSQPILVAVSIVITYGVYGLIKFLIPYLPWITIKEIGIGIFIYLSIVCVILFRTVKKLCKFNVEQEMRQEGEVHQFLLSNTKKDIIFVIVLSLCNGILYFLPIQDVYRQIAFICSIIIVFKSLNFICLKILFWIGEKWNVISLIFSDKLEALDGKRRQKMILLLAIGYMLFFGIRFSILSVEEIAHNDAINHLKYGVRVDTKETVDKETVNVIKKGQNIAPVLRFPFKIKESKYVKWLQGINRQYLVDDFEEIQFTYLSDSWDISQLDDENSDGILVPSYLIDESFIGKKRVINIEGKDIEFTIVGGYYPNTYHNVVWVCSKAYLEKQLHLPETANTFFVKEENISEVTDILTQSNISYSIETKSEIVKKSDDKVISGDEFLYMIAIIILVCALSGILSLLTINIQNTTTSIINLKCIGMNELTIKRIYTVQMIITILRAGVIGGILSIPFSKLMVYALMTREVSLNYAKYPALTWFMINVFLLGIAGWITKYMVNYIVNKNAISFLREQ